jgi:hypothetical protein
MTSDSTSLYFVTVDPPTSSDDAHSLIVTKTDEDLNVSNTLTLECSSLRPLYLTRGYSLYTNGHFLTIGVPLSTIEKVEGESSSSKKKQSSIDEECVPVKYFTFCLVTGSETSSSAIEYKSCPTTAPGVVPTVLAYDLTNNVIHGASLDGNIMRYRNMGLQPRLHTSLDRPSTRLALHSMSTSNEAVAAR